MTDTATRRTGAEEIQWDLADLYTGPDDPALATDLDAGPEQAEAFAATYRGRVSQLDAAGLAGACVALEQVWSPLLRASSYAMLRFAADTGDQARGALVARAHERAAAVSTATVFFDLEWNQIDDARAATLLAEDALVDYRHHLERTRLRLPHQLSEPEERLLSELAPTGAAAWARLFTQLEAAIRVELDGEDVSLEEALSRLQDGDRDRRRRGQEATTGALERDVSTRAFVLNTLLADKATVDRLRAHPHWLHARNLDNEADDSQVAALIEAVTGRYELVARYYRLKARLLGLEELFDYDRYAPLDVGEDAALDWDSARLLVLDAYRDFSPDLSDLAATFFDERWIDAAVTPGKQGGAFCHSVTPDVHPYVFVNYTGRARDALTVAHELGHGVHARLSQRQTLFNTETPLTTAETASIFGETVTLARLLRMESDPRRRLGLLTQRLEDQFAAIFRQVAMNRFEEVIHTTRRQEGELSVEAFNSHWLATQREMFAGSVTLTEGYASWWSYVPHFVAVPGYVYAYAFGNLLALALYRRYEEQGEAFVPQYLDLLSAGGSDSPNELLARMGVDLADPGFWDAGLEVLADEVTRAESLAAELDS